MNNSKLRREQIEEALSRLEENFGVPNDVLELFHDERHIISLSAQPSIFSLNPDSEDEKDLIDFIKNFETEHNYLVYYVIRDFEDDDSISDYLLYVSDNPNKWAEERDPYDIDGLAYNIKTYKVNFSHPEYNGFVSVDIVGIFGNKIFVNKEELKEYYEKVAEVHPGELSMLKPLE